MAEHDPADFVDELAAALAERLAPVLAPAELDDELAAWVRHCSASSGLWRFPIGDPVQPCYIEIRLNPDGSIRLELKDWYCQGARWSTVIRPASSTAPPAGKPNPATSGRRSRGDP